MLCSNHYHVSVALLAHHCLLTGSGHRTPGFGGRHVPQVTSDLTWPQSGQTSDQCAIGEVPWKWRPEGSDDILTLVLGDICSLFSFCGFWARVFGDFVF